MARHTQAKLLDDTEFDYVIRPNINPWTGFVEALWSYRNLMFRFVQRDFVTQYKQTVLGPTWFILQPLLTSVIFSVVFGTIAGISTGGVPPMLFYFTGNVVWQFFQTIVIMTGNTFRGNSHLFGKVYFPRITVPISFVASSLIKMIPQGLFLVGFWLFYRFVLDTPITLTPLLLLAPLFVAILSLIALSFGLVFSALTAKYRDATLLLDFVIRMAIYATPVIYPISALPPKIETLIFLNPLTPLFEGLRLGILGSGNFDPANLVYSVGFAFLSILFGLFVFNKTERNFIDSV